MRVLIFEGDSFLGSHIADRLQREGHDIVCVYTHKAKLGCYPSVPHTKYHYSNTLQQIERIVNNEKPQAIIYNREEFFDNISQFQSVHAAFLQLLEASVKFRVKKFIYISDISVYGKGKELFTEEDPANPETLDAKCHALSEASLSQWRPAGFFSNIILRMASTYGPRQNIFSHHIVWKMIRQASEKKEIHDGLDGSYSILYSGDAAEGVFRSLNEFAEGIYNITPNESVDGNQIAEQIHANFITSPPAVQPITQKPVNASSMRAQTQLGYVSRVNLERGIRHCYDWVTQNPKSVFNKFARSSRKSDWAIPLRYLETTGFFLVFALITYWQAGWSMATSINFMTIYLIITSAVLGTNYGVLAAFLVSCFNVYSSVANGMRFVTSLYDLNTMIQVVQNFLIGLSIGYVVEQKSLQIEIKEEVIEAQATELDYLNTLYDEMGEAKSELEYRLSEYEGSYGKINYIINRLNSLRPEEVFVNSLHVIRELVHEDNISLYIIDKKMLFLRRIAYVGKECTTLPSTFRLRSYPKVLEVIENKELYANHYMDTELPSMIVPIEYNETVLALIVLDEIHFNKLNLYYVNLMKIIATLINTAFYRAHEYELVSISKRYLPYSSVLLPAELEKQILSKKNMVQNSNYIFTALLIAECSTEEQILEKGNVVSSLIRSEDQLGLTKDGQLLLLLSATNEQYSKQVILRLAEHGVKASVIPYDQF